MGVCERRREKEIFDGLRRLEGGKTVTAGFSQSSSRAGYSDNTLEMISQFLQDSWSTSAARIIRD